MDWEKGSMRICALALAGAVGLRLAGLGAFAPVGQMIQSPQAMSLFFYLQTGRVVRMGQVAEEPEQTDPVRTSEPVTQESPCTFSVQEAQDLELTYNCAYRPDVEMLLTKPLTWNLVAQEPTVLILHTHTSECYTQVEGETYESSGAYRTLDEGYNMLCLGDLVAQRLEEGGVHCVHDRTVHDYPSYNDAYTHAGEKTAALLEQYPSIQLVLDLHRDAADTAYGQMVTQCSIGSQTAAQLMMVVGTDAGGLDNPRWEENLSLALKLQAVLQRENPGICRKLNLTYHRYNQHLGPYALLIEIGAAGNTLQEASLAAEKLAQGILKLAQGSA